MEARHLSEIEDCYCTEQIQRTVHAAPPEVFLPHPSNQWKTKNPNDYFRDN